MSRIIKFRDKPYYRFKRTNQWLVQVKIKRLIILPGWRTIIRFDTLMQAIEFINQPKTMELKVSRYNAANERYEHLRTEKLTDKQFALVSQYLDGLKMIPEFYSYETGKKRWFVSVGDAVGMCKSKFSHA